MSSFRDAMGRIGLRNHLMEIAETIAPQYKERRVDEHGNVVRYISVQDIHFDKKVDTDQSIEYRMNIDFLSDQGHWNQPVVVKEFSSTELLEEEILRYNQLKKRCSLFDDIDPYPIISLDRENLQIVYEELEGNTLDELNLSKDEYDIVMGRLAAILQGGTRVSLGDTSLRAFLDYIVQHMPFDEESREELALLLEPHYYIIPPCHGGYEPCILFLPEMMKFVKTGDSIKTHIPMITSDGSPTDRMSDIANIYTLDGVTEFSSSGHLNRTVQRVKNFFAGYNIVAQKLDAPNLEELYPNGITLDLQMLVSYALIEMQLMQHEQLSTFSNPDALKYIYFLLQNKPYLLSYT
ncbi:MAG: hypothetical protein ACW98K_15510 [Candidatus Kariarchaeaceae archaeon]|jgi:hypothetical protein